MNAAHRWLAVPFVALALTACGGGSKEPKDLPRVEDTVFGDMVGAMDKARGVETTMQQKKELDQAMEEAEGER